MSSQRCEQSERRRPIGRSQQPIDIERRQFAGSDFSE